MLFGILLSILLPLINLAKSQQSSNQQPYVYQGWTHNELTDEELGRPRPEHSSTRNPKFLFFKHYYTRVTPPLPYGYTPVNPNIATYDFIVVGSGSAGSALANRLSENPHWHVLLLEVGNEAQPIVDIPALAATFQMTDYNWGYTMEKQENMCIGMVEQRMAWPRGRALGGSTIINYMIHMRGNPQDYDRWAALGNPGWSYQDLLPYFIKMENSSVAKQDNKYHGRSGPVQVQDIPFRSASAHAWVRAAHEVGHNYCDYNGKKQFGVSYVQGTLRNGKRCSAEAAYLRNASQRANLHIYTNSRAIEVLFDDQKHVTGLRYIRNRQFVTAKVRKEVILSAGAFNSPQLLMLSGVGPQDHLKELGIPLKINLPVGQKLYDHLTFLGAVFELNDTITKDFTIKEAWLYDPKNLFRIIDDGDGPLTSLGGVEAIVFFKTEESAEKEKYPDMELIFIGGGLHTDKGQVYRKTFRITDEVYNNYYKHHENREAFTVLPMLIHPKSHGYLKLKSRNPYHWPKFYGNFFSDPNRSDIRTFIAAIREAQRICKGPTLARLGCRPTPIPIPGCEAHAFDSDAYWECGLRHVTGTLHHQIATCKMGPADDPEAIVDAKLKVYGTTGLRVADTSIIPIPIGAHTSVPAFMIGEKVADLIKEEWGVPGAVGKNDVRA